MGPPIAVEIRADAQAKGGGDAVLLARIAARDLRAFEDLYKKYRPSLSRFLFNLTRRPQIVEEVINDTLLVVWESAHKYNGDSKVSTWIFSIAYKKAIKAMKKQDIPIEDVNAEFRPSAEICPESALSHVQTRDLIARALKRLSPEHRAVVDLTYFHDHSYEEIAIIMNCPVNTVKTRMFYGRRKLKYFMTGILEDWI